MPLHPRYWSHVSINASLAFHLISYLIWSNLIWNKPITAKVASLGISLQVKQACLMKLQGQGCYFKLVEWKPNSNGKFDIATSPVIRTHSHLESWAAPWTSSYRCSSDHLVIRVWKNSLVSFCRFWLSVIQPLRVAPPRKTELLSSRTPLRIITGLSIK